MAKTKQIKASDVVSVPRQKPVLFTNYKPLPRFGAGCTNCK